MLMVFWGIAWFVTLVEAPRMAAVFGRLQEVRVVLSACRIRAGTP